MTFARSVVFLCLANTVFVTANFTLTVNFTHYTNPSGLCAECSTRLNPTSPNLNTIVPVCCDNVLQMSQNCNSGVDASCDTRFRWRLREHGASLESRPVTIDVSIPAYNFNPCNMTLSICPFKEISRTFEQGEMAFLGRSNPNDLTSSLPWLGRIQFFIESINNGLPNIIDSFLINLDTLQLGADFTEEMTFTGYHNISQMSMNFKVECASNYYGPDCTTLCEDNPGVFTCNNIGEIACVNVGGDPSNDCTICLPLYNISTNCTTCNQPGYDPADANCTQCVPNRDPVMNCTSCLPGYGGENCISDQSAVVGGVVGGLFVAALAIMIIVVVVVLAVKLGKERRSKKSSEITTVEDVQLKTQLEADTAKTNTTSDNQERDFENPLYESGAVAVPDNDYSAPWDSRASRNTQPIVVSSPSSSHAIAKRVNSNEPTCKNGGSVKKNVALPAVTRGSKRHQYENTKDPLPESPALCPSGGNNATNTSNSDQQPVYNNYAEPLGTALPVGVEPTVLYDYAESPNAFAASKGVVPIHYAETAGAHTSSKCVAMGSVDTRDPPDMLAPTYDYGEGLSMPNSLIPPTKVKAYEDNPLPGFKGDVDTTVYTNTTPGVMTMDAELHYDVGQ